MHRPLLMSQLKSNFLVDSLNLNQGNFLPNMPTHPNMKLFMDPFYIRLLLSSPLLATLLPPLLLLIVPTKRMCFCVGKVLDKRVIALLSRNGQKMFPAQIVLLFQTSDFYTLSDRKDPPFLPAAYGNTGCGVFKGGIQN